MGADINLLHLLLAPSLGQPHSNLTKVFGIKKLESLCVVCVILYLALLPVTDL